MSKRSKAIEILELVEWSADAALESVSSNEPPSVALGMEVGFETAERMVIDELAKRFTGGVSC
jgi:hypothetical protein